MKADNYISLKCTGDSFYRMWFEFLTPFHKLTSREKDVAARILLQHFKFKESGIKDPEVVRDLLWSKSSRKDLRSSLGMSNQHFQMVLKKLKETGVIVDGDINPRYIPCKAPDSSRFMLAIVFDWSSPSNPIHNEHE